MVPRGSPVPTLGSPRNVIPVIPWEKKQERTGGKERLASHTISLFWWEKKKKINKWTILFGIGM